MKNLGQMMRQAQEVQTKLAEVQERLSEIEVSGSAGGGMIEVVLSGKSEMRRVRIDPSLVDPDDVGVLEDLIVAATNDAKSKVEGRVQEEMQKVTGGLNLPAGFKLPF